MGSRFKVRAFSTLFVILLFTAGTARAQNNPRGGQSVLTLEHDVLPRAASKYRIPGIAVALIEHGQLSGIAVFGVRDKSSNAPVTERSVFEAGALGEPLYAYSVLVYASDGRFNPGAPLTNYLPLPYVRSFDPLSSSPKTEPLYDPAFAQITGLRVMGHTSGLPDWARNQPLALQFLPGRKWLFSSEGYVFLQRAVEQASGEALSDFVMRRILGPAGMRFSSFTWQDAFARDMATGYDRSGMPVESHRYSRPVATATLYTTIQDYARFIAGILASAPSQHAHESAVTLMLNPTIEVEGANKFFWGLGVGLEKSADDLYFFNRSADPGFQCFVMASRKTGNGVVILTNSGNGLDAVPDILAATIGGSHPALNSPFLQPH